MAEKNFFSANIAHLQTYKISRAQTPEAQIVGVLRYSAQEANILYGAQFTVLRIYDFACAPSTSAMYFIYSCIYLYILISDMPTNASVYREIISHLNVRWNVNKTFCRHIVCYYILCIKHTTQMFIYISLMINILYIVVSWSGLIYWYKFYTLQMHS